MMAEANRTIDCKNLAPFAEKMAEEEETYVFVEFTGLPDDNLLKQYKGTCSLLVRQLRFFFLCCTRCILNLMSTSPIAESGKLY